MPLKPINSTIEVWCDRKTGAPPKSALVLRGWFSPAWGDDADMHFRCISPDGVCWHVMVFDGSIDEAEARRLVRAVYDGHAKMIDLNPENYALP